MLQIMNQILTQGGFLRAFFQTVILIAAGCALFRADILGPGDKHALTTVVWKLAVPCMAFDAFMSDFNTQEFLSELGVLALSFVLYGALYALGTLLFRRAAGQDAKVYGLFCAVGQLTLFSMPVLQSIYAGTGSTVLISVSVMTIPDGPCARVRPRGGMRRAGKRTGPLYRVGDGRGHDGLRRAGVGDARPVLHPVPPLRAVCLDRLLFIDGPVSRHHPARLRPDPARGSFRVVLKFC